MLKNKKRDMVVMGFAIFAIFFGAGNLIFPPYLGQISGTDWFSAMLGFLTTDPILPVAGVIAAALIGGKADDLGKRVSPTFAKVIAIIAMLIIGPLFAIPRTAALVHEMAVQPWFEGAPIYISSGIYFAITLLLIFNQGKVIDIIGKYLTPLLLLVLTILIGKCIITPIGAIAAPAKTIIGTKTSYFLGFSEGFQTMDALGAGLTAGIVTTDMLRRGYSEKKDRITLSIGMAAVACLLLALVYGGLIYVGATASSLLPAGDYTRVELLLGVSKALLGNFGMILMACCVSVACLTTATGLAAMAGDFFSQEVFGGKVSYKIIVVISVIVSFIVSINGTEEIIKYAVPMLFLVYPVFVVLIFLTLFDSFIKYNQVYIYAVVLTLIVSFMSAVNLFYVAMRETPLAETPFAFMEPAYGFVMSLPLAEAGFPWLLPAVLGVVGGILSGTLFPDRQSAN